MDGGGTAFQFSYEKCFFFWENYAGPASLSKGEARCQEGCSLTQRSVMCVSMTRCLGWARTRRRTRAGLGGGVAPAAVQQVVCHQEGTHSPAGQVSGALPRRRKRRRGRGGGSGGELCLQPAQLAPQYVPGSDGLFRTTRILTYAPG